MKRIASILTTFVFALNAFAGNETLTSSNHPRLIISEMEMNQIRSQVKSGSNEALVSMHDAVMDKADELLYKPDLVYKKDASGKRILGISRDAAQRISYFAYAYRFTRERKYLQRALETMTTVCEFPDWNPRHYLDVGEMSSGVAIGYDWLYNEMTPQMRELVEETLRRYAFDTMDLDCHENIWVQMNNRNQVNLSGLVCAALSIYETCPDVAQTVIDRAVESNYKVVEHIYNPGGAYPEGPGYWCYGTGYQAWMNILLKENMGSDYGLSDIPGFRETPWFEVFASGSKYLFNYSDCREPDIARYPLWYFADLLGNPSILFTEVAYLKQNDYTVSQQRALIFIALKYAARINPSEIVPSERTLYAADGDTPVAIVRTGWGPEDQWLAFKGGKASSSHAHMDAGEFVYDAYGVRWSKDVGFYTYDIVEKPLHKAGGNYWGYEQESLRWQISRVNCHWHSCLIFDQKDLLVDGMATIVDSYDSPARKGAVMDMTPLYMGVKRVERSVSLCDDEYLEVVDRIECGSKGHTVRFNMVSEAEPQLVEDGIVLTRNGVSMKFQTSGADVRYKIWSADPTGFNSFAFEQPAPDTYICGYTVKLPKNSSVSLTTTLRRME